MSIDETALSNGEVYTVITNKDAHGKKGALAALIMGTKAEIVSEALRKVPISIRMKVKEITLDFANNMDLSDEFSECNSDRRSFPYSANSE